MDNQLGNNSTVANIKSNISPSATISRSLVTDIKRMGLKHGAKLVPLRELAIKYDTSYPTMRKVVGDLCRKGVLSKRQGSGVYISSQESIGEKSHVRKKNIISMVFCGFEAYITSYPLYTKVLSGVEKEANRHGYEIVMSSLRQPEQFRDTEIYTNASAFLMLGDSKIKGIEGIFKEKPVVWMMGTEKSWGDHITYDNKSVGILAAERFLSDGHTNLAYLNVDPKTGKERCLSFQEHAQAKGANVLGVNDYNAMIKGRFEEHVDPEVMSNWVDRLEKANPRPTGVFVSDMLAYPLYNTMIERGIRPGKDIEIATCNWGDGTPFSGIKYRPFNIDLYPEEIGMAAVRQLSWRLDNSDLRRIVMKLEPSMEEKN
jgi:DNA-binding LacI/PurR family transcriptional regulator